MIGQEFRRLYWEACPSTVKDFANAFFYSALPSGVRDNISRWLKANYYQEAFEYTGIVFIHIPRAAGTSVNRAIYGVDNVGHLRVQGFLSKVPTLFSGAFKFAITRNPWDRLVSAFEFARNGGGQDIRISFPGKYAKFRGREFSEFAMMLADSDLNTMDPVFRTQCYFLLDESGSMPLDYLGRFEEIDEVQTRLAGALGYSVSLSRMSNQSRRADYRSYYKSDRIVELVGSLYREDVALQRYEFDG
jgi:hypothetical protein